MQLHGETRCVACAWCRASGVSTCALAWMSGPSILKPDLNSGLRKACLFGQLLPGGDSREAIVLKGLNEKSELGRRDGGALSSAFFGQALLRPRLGFCWLLLAEPGSLVLKPNVYSGLGNADLLGQFLSGAHTRVGAPLEARLQALLLTRAQKNSPPAGPACERVPWRSGKIHHGRMAPAFHRELWLAPFVPPGRTAADPPSGSHPGLM